jgi:2-polyprenyl-3-methyl-5-hydroxy-6-metoxy-1,4-benzoquinol methylase
LDNRQQHNLYQQRIFNTSVDCFRQVIPADVENRTEQIVAAAELTAGDRVLDVGTGIGVLIPHIQRFGVRYIVGCDLSAAMLSEAEKRYPNVRFWCGDVIDISRDLGPFDVVFFNAVFGNMWNQRHALESTSALLTPTGRIIISHPMGAAFAEQLRAKDPKMIPHSLPGKKRTAELIQGLPLKMQYFCDEECLYLCVVEHVPTS